MKTMFLIFVVSSGCMTGDFSIQSNQEQAIDFVWRGIYGATTEPPAIGWRQAECGKPVKWFDGYYEEHTGFVDDYECKGGFFQAYPRQINLVKKDRLFRTALAHELYHAYLNDTTGDADQDHKGISWLHQSDPSQGDVDGIVETARKHLIEAGY